VCEFSPIISLDKNVPGTAKQTNSHIDIDVKNLVPIDLIDNLVPIDPIENLFGQYFDCSLGDFTKKVTHYGSDEIFKPDFI